MTNQSLSLSYQVRRELLEQAGPRYHTNSPPQKTLLLNAFGDLTGSTRPYTTTLLNRVTKRKPALLNLRLLLHGRSVQHACISGLTSDEQTISQWEQEDVPGIIDTNFPFQMV
jgi:hypothetical protein